jgi:hypothetical protein
VNPDDIKWDTDDTIRDTDIKWDTDDTIQDTDITWDKPIQESTKPSGMVGFLKWADTNLISPETFEQKYPVSSVVGMAEPIYNMISGKAFIAPQYPEFPTYRGGAEFMSKQTSPLQIATNLLAGAGLLKSFNKLPAFMGKDYVYGRSKQGAMELDKMRKSIGEAKRMAIESVGTTPIPNFKPTFARQVLDKLKDPIYEIEFTKAGAIKPTMKNLDRVMDALGDFMTTATWEEAGKKLQQSVKQSYRQVREYMTKTVPSIKKPIENYSKFMDSYRVVNKTLRNTAGDILDAPLKGAFEVGAERAKYEAWKALSKNSKVMGRIMSDMAKWHGRQFTKTVFKDIGANALRFGLPVGVGSAIGGGIGYAIARKAR